MRHTLKNLIRGLKDREAIDIYIVGISFKTFNPEELRVFKHDRSMFYSYCRILKPTKVTVLRANKSYTNRTMNKDTLKMDIFKRSKITNKILKAKIVYQDGYAFFDTLTEAEEFLRKSRNKAINAFELSRRPQILMYNGMVDKYIEKLNTIK